MYPRLSDMINDLFGTNINLPIQSYGFFLALAFLIGAFLLYKELDRKEKQGFINPTKKKVTKGEPPKVYQLIIVFISSLIAGFKIGGFITEYDQFVTNPQHYVFSLSGSWIIGSIFGVLYTLYFYFSKSRRKLEEPLTETVDVQAKEQTMPILFIAIIFGIIGAKIFNWFENWDEFMSDPIGSLVSFSGLTFYGGLIFAFIACIYYAKRKNISWKHLTDAVAPSLILSYGIGRIGCHVAGDGDWGIVNLAAKPGWLNFLPDWLWAYHYPHNIINEGAFIPGCQGPHCFQLIDPVYPTPIYETIMAVLIFALLWSIRKKLNIPGALFAIYLMFNGIERFLIELIRVNVKFTWFGITFTQAELISTLMFLTGVVLLIIFIRTSKKPIKT
jgi:phosphatidylglycerol---prolipoprotein diacylglyceryl transferase